MEPRRAKIDLDNVVYGVHAVEEALAAGEQLRHIHVAQERRRDPALRKIMEAAREREIRVRTEDRKYFSQFPYKAHQGVIAFGPPYDYASLEDLLVRPRGGPLLLVVLDHITDPHNAGAIIRTAECAGAHGAVMPERRAAGVNATVRKAAAGAAAHLPVARVANVAETIRKLKKANVWVAGAGIAPQSIAYTQADFTRDAAIVIGGEEGLSPLVARECDYLVRIPLLGRTESLNASVAAAVLLYEAVRQRGASESALRV
ncbi:MAG: 23S rRNA (guanosine(2251)-2'-O)-methyltransferase RlmB [Candidatus Baltobacteraceae bacterium]